MGTPETMDAMLKRSFADERFRTTLISVFGVLAALLAAVGMYGVTARAVAARTREVGIRVALGATPGSVVLLLVRSTLVGVGVGVATGLALAFVGARWVSPVLYGIDARNPATYGGIVALLGAVSLIASWVPARRATHVHPAGVLRGE